MSTSIITVADTSTSSIDALVTDSVITRANIDKIIKTTSKLNIVQSATTPVASARGMLLYPIVLYFLQTIHGIRNFQNYQSNLFMQQVYILRHRDRDFVIMANLRLRKTVKLQQKFSFQIHGGNCKLDLVVQMDGNMSR